MKQKIYSLILIFISIIIFTLFSLIFVNDKKSTDNFEVIITGTTETLHTTQITQTTAALNLSYKSTNITYVTTINSTVTTTADEVEICETEPETEPVVFPININTAGINELTALNGIGETTAAAIIEYRETNGLFRNRNELINVNGIGEKKLADIYESIFVENESYDTNNDVYDVYEQPCEEYIDYEEYSEPQEEYTEEITEEIPAETAEETTVYIVNLNNASKEELMRLPYVDDVIADDIIELRNTIQHFNHPYELLMLESLSQEQATEIIKYVTV